MAEKTFPRQNENVINNVTNLRRHGLSVGNNPRIVESPKGDKEVGDLAQLVPGDHVVDKVLRGQRTGTD